mgnify:CR=1 FL=1
MIIKQIENFFPRLDFILPEIKKIKLYTQKEFNEHEGTSDTWPGYRSLCLTKNNVFLFELINNLIFSKGMIDHGNYYIMTFLHLRLKEHDAQDWIHKDNSLFSALIYLSETNLNSGTYIYNEDENIVNDIKFVKNRFVMFSGNYKHKGYGHYGDSVQNGRLTLNLFINKNAN